MRDSIKLSKLIVILLTMIMRETKKRDKVVLSARTENGGQHLRLTEETAVFVLWYCSRIFRGLTTPPIEYGYRNILHDDEWRNVLLMGESCFRVQPNNRKILSGENLVRGIILQLWTKSVSEMVEGSNDLCLKFFQWPNQLVYYQELRTSVYGI